MGNPFGAGIGNPISGTGLGVYVGQGGNSVGVGLGTKSYSTDSNPELDGSESTEVGTGNNPPFIHEDDLLFSFDST